MPLLKEKEEEGLY